MSTERDPTPEYPERWEEWWYDSAITIAITPPHSGWIDIIIAGTPRGGLASIACSNVFDPLPDLLGWFHCVADGSIPAECVVDEEGCAAVWQALPVEGRTDWIEFRITRRTALGPDESTSRRIFHTRANRRQLVREFCRRFEQWRREDYADDQWQTQSSFGCEANGGLCTADVHKMDIRELQAFAGLA